MIITLINNENVLLTYTTVFRKNIQQVGPSVLHTMSSYNLRMGLFQNSKKVSDKQMILSYVIKNDNGTVSYLFGVLLKVGVVSVLFPCVIESLVL